MTATRAIGLRLDPLDVLLFRDGRPFDAAARVSGGLPTPQTLAGALRTALLAREGFRFGEFAKLIRTHPLREALTNSGAPDWVIDCRFRGPWPALALADGRVEPLLLPPAVVSAAKDPAKRWLRATPLEAGVPAGWSDLDNLLPVWRKGEPDTKAGGALLTLTGVKEFLRTPTAVPADTEAFRPSDVYDFDDRIGIGMDMHTLTSEEGQLYGIRLLAMKSKVTKREHLANDPYADAPVCLYAEVLPPEGAPPATDWFADALPFGGEGHYVRVQSIPPCDWQTDAGGPRSLWYLASPAFLPFSPKSGRPLPRIPGLTAAASGPGLAVSGWDVARNGPRPTRFAVPAGAVYFVDGPGDEAAFRGTDAEAAEGWGFALQGAW
jgi:CRISPR-associated protein Cmr3